MYETMLYPHINLVRGFALTFFLYLKPWIATLKSLIGQKHAWKGPLIRLSDVPAWAHLSINDTNQADSYIVLEHSSPAAPALYAYPSQQSHSWDQLRVTWTINTGPWVWDSMNPPSYSLGNLLKLDSSAIKARGKKQQLLL